MLGVRWFRPFLHLSHWRLPAAAAATSTGVLGARAALGLFVRRHWDDFKTNVSKGDFFANTANEGVGFLIRLTDRAQLNLDGFADKLRIGLNHFPIENEGKIGVEFSHKLMVLGFVALPETVFVHRKNECVRMGVVGKGVEDAGMFKSVHHAGNLWGTSGNYASELGLDGWGSCFHGESGLIVILGLL